MFWHYGKLDHSQGHIYTFEDPRPLAQYHYEASRFFLAAPSFYIMNLIFKKKYFILQLLLICFFLYGCLRE